MGLASSTTGVGSPEPLLFPAGLDAIKNVTLNASLIAPDPANSNRRILLAGTLLKKVAEAGPGRVDQYAKYDGTGRIEGVLALDAEVLDGTSNQDIQRGMFYNNCVFRASRIVDYSTYGDAAISTMQLSGNCKFENV